MARPKAFDPAEVLDGAIRTFRAHGYGGTSMARLTGAMGIGRASLYATYGNKHALFLKALSTYARQTVSHLVARLDGATDPIEAIGGVLHEVAARASEPAGR